MYNTYQGGARCDPIITEKKYGTKPFRKKVKRFETVEIISGIEGATHLNKNLTIGQAIGMNNLTGTEGKREEVFFYVVLISCLIKFHSSDSVLTSPLREASRSLSRIFRNCETPYEINRRITFI